MDMITHDIFPELGEACLMGLYNIPSHGFPGFENRYRESRQDIRLNCLFDVDLWVDGHLYRSVTHNVSYNGMFIETCKSFENGRKVFMCMRLNQGTGLFCVEGEVTWNSPHGIGVRLFRD